ncbi:MAG: glycosyltransferase family 4 protein, partial [Acidimicrobiales bacterium]
MSLDVSAVPDQPVGAGRYTIDLAAALAQRDDIALMLWSRRRDRRRWPTPATVRAVAPVSRPARLAWEQLRLPGLLARSGAAVHHGPHYTMPQRARLPMVVTIHDMTFLDHPEWHERTKVPVFSRAIRVAAQRADALICVSRYTAELLEQRTTPRGRLFVIPHGVDHDRFRPEEPDQGADEQVLHRLGVRLPFVLFLGTLEPRKSVPDLVRAFERVATVRPDVSLVLAGRPGWRAHEIERTLADTPATGRIVRTGYVPDAEVPALLRRAAAVAYPAREEGFGLPALEALACGAPLVTTRGTAMAELAGDA